MIDAALPPLAEIERASELIRPTVPPTPQYRWPLLCERTGADVIVKHENHTPTGAFKVRGGIVYVDELRRTRPDVAGVIAATRGNHGQSVAIAARAAGVRSVIVVPHGNSAEKNAAMRSQGGELIEHGDDFQAALEHARELADELGLHMFPSFHRLLVVGVATYALELFRAHGNLDTVYVPIGLGSGACAVIAARDALGLRTRVVGVVAERAAAYAMSFEAGRPVSTDSADTIADGVACRVPNEEALAIMLTGLDRVVAVSEDEIRSAMRAYFTDTHNVAEGAGAAPLAALLKERERMAGARVGLVLTGGNVDAAVFAGVLAGV